VSLENLAHKTVTVAGASGFVGQHLVEKLSLLGVKVKAVFNEHPISNEIQGVEYVRANLMSQEGARVAARDTDVFVMAAASSSGAAVMANNPLAHLVPNVVMNGLTMESCLEAGVGKYCFISSNTVYPPSEEPMKEGDASGEFFSSYEVVAEMKLFSEKMAEFFSTKSSTPMDTLVIRPGNLYGPKDKFGDGKSKVIPALIKRAVGREDPFSVWGDGKDIKDFLYIDDFIEALTIAISQESKFDILNVASGQSVPLKEVIEKILRISGNASAKLEFDESKPSMIPVRRIDISRATQQLGWTPKVDLESGLRKTIDWYKSIIQEKV
jgi:GDP-L-fucose synthase